MVPDYDNLFTTSRDLLIDCGTTIRCWNADLISIFTNTGVSSQEEIDQLIFEDSCWKAYDC